MVAPVGFGTQIKKKKQQRPANMGAPPPQQSLSPRTTSSTWGLHHLSNR